MEVTLPSANLKADPYVFLKEISTNGNVNTIDVIYPAVTAMTVLAPEWIKYLLGPVVDYLATGRWPQKYVVHDMGLGTLFVLLNSTENTNTSISLPKGHWSRRWSIRKLLFRGNRQLPDHDIRIPKAHWGQNMGTTTLNSLPRIRRLPRKHRSEPASTTRHRRRHPRLRESDESGHHSRHRLERLWRPVRPAEVLPKRSRFRHRDLYPGTWHRCSWEQCHAFHLQQLLLMGYHLQLFSRRSPRSQYIPHRRCQHAM